jgi:hypothetical protein
MGRLIDVQDAAALPSSLRLGVGDVLVFSASGGHVRSGAGVIEILGAFIPGVLRENGEIVSPMGAPNTVLFLARRPGRATIDVVTGDPYHASRSTTLEITVES